MNQLSIQAFGFGLLSAFSLVLGALTILVWKPKDKMTAFLMAFGGGALLSALTIDLVGSALERGHFVELATGCTAGGFFYVMLNQIVNSHGGFLRKVSTTLHHFKIQQAKNNRLVFHQISHVSLFRQLPAEEIHEVVGRVHKRSFKQGTTIFRQGEPGDSLHIIVSGAVSVINTKDGMKLLATLSSGDIVGEMALLTGEPRSATVVADSDVNVLTLYKHDFDNIIEHNGKIKNAFRNLTLSRIADQNWKTTLISGKKDNWYNGALNSLEKVNIVMPDSLQIKKASVEHKGAPIAIWLGNLIDSIPESVVIGSSILHSSVSFSLIAGLFLSNYPEALSSSAGMKEQGKSNSKIFWMWASLMLLTGVGAFLGNIFFSGASPRLFSLAEGLAAGAMLVMISETMLPEAFVKGGSITGISTLMGFLVAIFFKTLE